MKSRYEDEIPTNPGHRTHSDLYDTVGTLMYEVINIRKRVEVLEALALSQKTGSRHSDGPRTHLAEVAIIAKKAVFWGVIVTAGVISALRELGFLNP